MDWKATLAGLEQVQEEVSSQEVHNSQAHESAMEQLKTHVVRRKRIGVVYSSDPDYAYASAESSDIPCNVTPAQQPLRVRVERKGRGGKTVSVLCGFQGTEDALAALARQLKRCLGLGGTVKDGEIIIQGDVVCRLLPLLHKLGYISAR